MEVTMTVKYLHETHNVSIKVSDEVLETVNSEDLEQYLLAKVYSVVKTTIKNLYLDTTKGGLRIDID